MTYEKPGRQEVTASASGGEPSLELLGAIVVGFWDFEPLTSPPRPNITANPLVINTAEYLKH